jgi:hypothetical protein
MNQPNQGTRTGKTRQTVAPPSGEVFVIVLFLLAGFSAVSTAIGWFNNSDVKGWWPLIISGAVLFDAIYAVVFVLISRWGRNFGRRFVVCYTAVLGLVIVAHSLILNLMKIDWLAVSNGKIALGLLEKAVHTDAAFYATYAVFLIVAAMLALFRRHRPMQSL